MYGIWGMCVVVWVGLVPRQSGQGIIYCRGWGVTEAADETGCRELRGEAGTRVWRETMGPGGIGAEGKKAQ